MPGTEREMSTLKLQIEALVRVLQAPSPEDQALTMRQQTLARRERARKMALEALSKGPAKAEKIGEALGLNAVAASHILKGLIKNGLVRNKGGSPATYAIIERGARCEDVLAAAPDVQGEPVAYAVFADNGNIRIWSADPIQAEAMRLKYGDQVRPLYAAPQPAPGVAELDDYEALQAECDQLRKDAERYRWLREQCQKPVGGLTIATAGTWELGPWSGDDPDEAIDHARRIEGDGE